MAADPLSRAATDARLRALREAGVLDEASLPAALKAAVASPDDAAWVRFLDRALLLLGAALVLAGIVFFFAYNWDDLGRFARFGLLGGASALCAAGAWRVGPERLGGQVLLAAAAILVGPLLAVYGQAYQTGADAWQLFAAWALLALPWTLAARFEPLWLAILAVAETALALAWVQVIGGEDLGHPAPWLVLALGPALAWGLRERLGEPASRWLPRVLAAAVFTFLTLAAVFAVFDPTPDGAGVLAMALLFGAAAAAAWRFQERRRDLFVLAVVAGALVTFLTTALGRAIVDGAAGLFVLGLVLVGELAAATAWLRWAASRGEPAA